MKYKTYILTILSLFIFTNGFTQDTLNLSDAINIALYRNYDILIAYKNQDISKNNNTLGNAGFYPQVNTDFGYTHNISTFDQKTARGIFQGENIPGNIFSSRVMLNWTIFDGFNMFITKSKLNEFQKLGEIQTRMAIDETLSNLFITYFLIIQQTQAIKIVKDAIKLSLERKKLAEVKYSIGSGSELMLLQSVVDMNADSSMLMQQESVLRTLKADLNIVLSRDIATDFIINDSININKNLILADLQVKIENQNPELLMSQINNNISFKNLKQTYSSFYPKINLFGGYNFGKTESGGYISYNLNYGPTFGLTANWTIFNAFNRKLAEKNARVALDIANMNYEKTQLEIQSTLFKLFTNYQTAHKQIELEISNVKVAQRNLLISKEKYNLGMMSDIDLRIVQQKTMDAENQLLVSQFQAKSCEIQLLRLSGDLMNQIK